MSDLVKLEELIADLDNLVVTKPVVAEGQGIKYFVSSITYRGRPLFFALPPSDFKFGINRSIKTGQETFSLGWALAQEGEDPLAVLNREIVTRCAQVLIRSVADPEISKNPLLKSLIKARAKNPEPEFHEDVMEAATDLINQPFKPFVGKSGLPIVWLKCANKEKFVTKFKVPVPGKDGFSVREYSFNSFVGRPFSGRVVVNAGRFFIGIGSKISIVTNISSVTVTSVKKQIISKDDMELFSALTPDSLADLESFVAEDTTKQDDKAALPEPEDDEVAKTTIAEDETLKLLSEPAQTDEAPKKFGLNLRAKAKTVARD